MWSAHVLPGVMLVRPLPPDLVRGQIRGRPGVFGTALLPSLPGGRRPSRDKELRHLSSLTWPPLHGIPYSVHAPPLITGMSLLCRSPTPVGMTHSRVISCGWGTFPSHTSQRDVLVMALGISRTQPS